MNSTVHVEDLSIQTWMPFRDGKIFKDHISHRIHVWLYLPTFTVKNQLNLGKFTIHGSYGFSLCRSSSEVNIAGHMK